jgi:hypothetical protein
MSESNEPKEVTEAERLASEHWGYISSLLRMHAAVEVSVLPIIEFHYTTAFIHGYKHGLEMGV